MIVLKENQRLYLHSCNYNMARMMSALANLVKEHGGRVKPTRQALISDRNCKDAEPIKVTHTSYISFVLNDVYYYYQVDDNPFFPFYYIKTPIKNGKYSMDAALEETKKGWLIDSFWGQHCSESNIHCAAEFVFNELSKARMSTVIRDFKRTKVPNLYDDVPFPVSWTVKMKKKQKETQDILSYHSQAAGCSDKARAKASGGRQPIEECGRTGL